MRLLVPVFTLFALLTVNFVNAQPSAAPANPNASPQARAVLDYLYGLVNRADNRVISGQMGAYGDGETNAIARQNLEDVFNQTGVYPALTGVDCATPEGRDAAAQYLVEMWRAGYLVTYSCHFQNPFNGESAGWNDGWQQQAPAWRRFNLSELLDPTTAAGGRWQQFLDREAAVLARAKAAGVVVLFRPLHEGNGGWFWWIGQSPAQYVALWRHMFNYFTNVKGLNNLLWVYSPNHAYSAELLQTLARQYPGNEYVDVVSLDKYRAATENPLLLGGYTELIATGKPFGLFEFGAQPANGSAWNTPNVYHWPNLMRDIKATYPRVVLFQAWEWIFALGRTKYNQYTGLRELMRDSWVVSRDELPVFGGGALPTATPPVVNPTSTPTISPPSATWYPTNTATATSTPTVPVMTTVAPTSTPPPLACMEYVTERVQRFINGVLVEDRPQTVRLRAC